MDGNPVPVTNVYLTNINKLGRPGGDNKEMDVKTVMFEKGTDNNFTLTANKSVESAEILCRGVNKFGSLSASRILYVHGMFHIGMFHNIGMFHIGMFHIGMFNIGMFNIGMFHIASRNNEHEFSSE